MVFKDRADAGRKLANALLKYQGENAVVLALPRGGVVLGGIIAKMLHIPLDLILTKKIGHPMNPEYAICAIAEHGEPVCDPAVAGNIDPRWFAAEVSRVRMEIKRRRDKYLGENGQLDVAGKTVIIVDDGIATGFTMIAAIHEIKSHRPERIVVAIPVMPYDTAQKIGSMVDDLVSLFIDPHYRGAVGAYYEDFEQVEDDEVMAVLKSAREYVL